MTVSIHEHEFVVAERDALRREVDALRSHQESVEATHRITLRDVQKEVMRLQSENDALRQQLDELAATANKWASAYAEKEAEIERLESSCKSIAEANERLGTRVIEAEKSTAASQAREQQLREALHHSLGAWHYDGVSEEHGSIFQEASYRCDSPADDSALAAMITKAGDVALKRAIAAASAINPIYGSGAAIDAISTVRIVTLDDLKDGYA